MHGGINPRGRNGAGGETRARRSLWERSTRLRQPREEAGFALPEVTAAVAILAIISLSMAVALANGFKYLTTAKQRAAAVQAANAVIERARAVGSADWTQLGIVSSDIAGDANITTAACGTVPSASMYTGEPVISAGTTTTNPLYPHVQQMAVGPTTLTLKTYVTGVTPGSCSVTNPTYKHVVVLATWIRGQTGVTNEVRLATYIYKAVRPPDPAFQGTASYSAGHTIAHSSNPTNGSMESAVYMPQSTADSRNAGRVEVASGSGTTPLSEVDGVIISTQHQATSIADDDDLTSIPSGVPSPVCASGSWTDFIGGLLGLNVFGTASSCSTIAAAADGLPNANGTASLANGVSIVSQVPAGGSSPAFAVTNFNNGNALSTVSLVDRLASGANQRIMSTATATLATLAFLKFNVLGFNAFDGAVQSSGGVFTATAYAGQGTASDAVPSPVVTGGFTFKIYDPTGATTGCSSWSGSYCIVPVDPTVPGFAGFDKDYNVVLTSGSTRITLTSNVVVQAPTTDITHSGNDVTFEKATYPMPKITTQMLVESPAGTTVATVDADGDMGQLIAYSSYAAA